MTNRRRTNPQGAASVSYEVAMAEPINLNQARKTRAKADAKATASQNRVKHGRTGAQKAVDRAEADKATARLDAHRRHPEGDAQ